MLSSGHGADRDPHLPAPCTAPPARPPRPQRSPTEGRPIRRREAARVIRSKNAGPTQVTIDLMFDDPKLYARALAAPSLKPAVIAQRYGVAEAEVIPYPAANAIKIVLPRRVIAGSPGDTDVYGAQQHRPMIDVEI
ncbi:MAG: DUF4387 domain-containing protein [Hyphomicrobiaceae bacterium]